jgi:hypothetical protein
MYMFPLRENRLMIRAIWRCLAVTALVLGQLTVSVFAHTNYCTTCRQGCLEHNHQDTPVRVAVQSHCPETPRSCCALTPCDIVSVDDLPFAVTAPEHPTPVGLLGTPAENLAWIGLPEISARWPHIEAHARSAPLYLQHLSLLC